MNESDAEVMAGLLSQGGYKLIDAEDKADILLLNTCSVRDSAEHKAQSMLGVWGLRKKADPRLVIGVVGCMAQNHKVELTRRMPYLDIICGPQNIKKIPQLIDRVLLDRRLLVEVGEAPEFSLKAVPIERSDPFRAYVVIMRGCDNGCTYCIVPKTRGAEISRDPREIMDEVCDLAARGYKEVTLLGQNVNSYGKGLPGGAIDFAELLRRVHSIRGIQRIRFVTSHPRDISERMIEALGDLPKVCEYLHFPLQSGSDRILRRMKRGYTLARYKKIVQKLRAAKPGIALSTDIIVGFPGETRQDFEQTLSALKEIQFDVGFLFKYSARKGTPAEKLHDDVPKKEKEARHQEVLKLQNAITLERNLALIGKDVEILVEGPSEGIPSRWAGRTLENKLAIFPSGLGPPGDIITLKGKEATAYTLRCEG